MKSLEYERAVRELRTGEDGKRFIAFYRNSLKPVLQTAIVKNMATGALGDRELQALSQYSKLVDDMEVILNRLIHRGEQAERILADILKQINPNGGVKSARPNRTT
jgi:hypothetical protein